MLRDGQTGDWIGTFIGHKGAVWQARLSHDALSAATASADFTAKVWDPHTGECHYTISHNHIVRAVAFPPDNSDLIATGGYEKKLRIFDLSEASASAPPVSPENGDGKAQDGITIKAENGFEIGAGSHQASIKFIVWTRDTNVLVTAAGNTLRWLDLPSRSVIKEEVLDGEIGSCEFNSPAPELLEGSDIGGGLPVLAVAAGKMVYFWGGAQAMDELKRTKLGYKVASVAVDTKGRRFIVGEDTPSTWARVYQWDDDSEYGTLLFSDSSPAIMYNIKLLITPADVHKGHHGPVWSLAYAPDTKLYATASEDGTIKLWKNCDGPYGLWRAGDAQPA